VQVVLRSQALQQSTLLEFGSLPQLVHLVLFSGNGAPVPTPANYSYQPNAASPYRASVGGAADSLSSNLAAAAVASLAADKAHGMP